MGLVLAIAVAFAALRGANEYWAGGQVLAVLGLLGISILASIHRQGIARAAWLGFLVVGGGYFLAVRTLPAQEYGWLPTSQLLTYVERQVIGTIAFTVNVTSAGTVTTTSLPSTPPTPAATTTIIATPGSPTVWNFANNISENNVRVLNSSGRVLTTWAPILPGAANGEAFKSVGHSLFALLAGWIGTGISLQMFARQSLLPANQNSPVAVESSNVL